MDRGIIWFWLRMASWGFILGLLIGLTSFPDSVKAGLMMGMAVLTIGLQEFWNRVVFRDREEDEEDGD